MEYCNTDQTFIENKEVENQSRAFLKNIVSTRKRRTFADGDKDSPYSVFH